MILLSILYFLLEISSFALAISIATILPQDKLPFYLGYIYFLIRLIIMLLYLFICYKLDNIYISVICIPITYFLIRYKN